jgi:formylglycine-generating enzyme required for sulfatase activity
MSHSGLNQVRVDPHALGDALAGAGMDVYYEEPTPTVELDSYGLLELVRTVLGACLAGDLRDRPLYWQDSRFNLPTAPVVGVNLWEARAYCGWLQRKLRGEQLIRPNDVVALPTEVEWEWAAGGYGTGRRNAYPWGDSFDPQHCIVRDFGGRSPDPKTQQFGAIPVGFFGLGASTVGPEDMAGNAYWDLGFRLVLRRSSGMGG